MSIIDLGRAENNNLDRIAISRWEEFRLYHRKDGKVVKEDDDLMAATRYALMMLRFASTKAAYDGFRRPIDYPKIGIV